MSYYRRVLATKTNYYMSDREVIAQLRDFREKAISPKNKKEES